MDRCYDLKNIFAEKFSEKNWRFLLKIKLNFEKLIITLVFKKSANFFSENCDHTIESMYLKILGCWLNMEQDTSWVRIQIPVVTYDKVSTDLFAELPIVFAYKILIFANNC
jgi:hypothetical protein